MKHYVEFGIKGLVLPREREIAVRDISKIEVPEKAEKFCFFDEADSGEIVNVTPVTYWGTEYNTAEKIQELYPERTYLSENIRKNGRNVRCVVTWLGSFYPIEEDAIVISR